MVSGITTLMAIVIALFDVSGRSKLDVVPGGGISAGVGVASLVVVSIFKLLFSLVTSFRPRPYCEEGVRSSVGYFSCLESIHADFFYRV